MRLSPTLHKFAMKYNAFIGNPGGDGISHIHTIIEDNIDFWYDSLNDCYNNGMRFDMIGLYIEAIIDEDFE